jgi:hypothetical protein
MMSHPGHASSDLKFLSSNVADGSSGKPLDNLVRELQVPQPVREDYIENAVKFLSHPKVKGSPVFHVKFKHSRYDL